MSLTLSFIGYSTFLGLMYFALNSIAYRWKLLAAVYATRQWPNSPNGTKYMQAVILFGGAAFWRSYAGITTIAVTDDGIWLKLLPPFSLFHKPLMLPFSDLKVQDVEWYLNATSVELIAEQASEIRIVITGDLLDWITENVPDWRLQTRRWRAMGEGD